MRTIEAPKVAAVTPHRRRGLPIRFKLAVAISAVAIGIVLGVGAVLAALHLDPDTMMLRHKGQRYVRRLSRELAPVVARGDHRATARAVFDSLASDVDVEAIAVYAADGHLIEGRGEVPARLPDQPPTRSTFVVPIASPDGATGTAMIRLGAHRADVEPLPSFATSVGIGGGTAVLAFLIAWLIARSVTQRLDRIATAASHVARGDLSQPALAPGPSDEIGRLAIDFNTMIDKLRTLFDERQAAAVLEQQRLASLVTSRTRELEESREQYRLIAESTNAIPFTYLPDDDRFTYIGPQVTRIIGHDVADWREPGFLGRAVVAKELPALRAGLAADQDIAIEVAIASGTGKTLAVRIVAAPGRADGARCMRGMMLDLTEARRMERELGHAQKLESVGRLAAGIAHEINTPVQFTADNVVFIRDSAADLFRLIEVHQALRRAVVEGRSAAEVTAAAAAATEAEATADLTYLQTQLPIAVDRSMEGLARVATIVKAMKEFAHPQQTGMVMADLNKAIRSTATVARNEYKYVADLELDLGTLPPVRCDLGGINQAVLNIIVNAAHAIGDSIKGTGGRGRITIATWVEDGAVAISIADTGGGIPEAIRGHVFDPFFTTKAVGKGTGQGLAIARAIVVEKHGGTLTFDTELGRGTVFQLRLPIAPAADAAA